MKRKLLYLLLLGLLGLGSCKKEFLDLFPKTSVTEANFYQTAAQFDQAIIGTYSNLRAICSDGMTRDEMRSDNTWFTYYNKDRSSYGTESIPEFMDDNVTAPGWGSDFAGVAKLNTIIDRLDASALTADQKNAVLAEASFLRAFFYFDLVQHWGPVPLMLHEITTANQAYQPNSTINAIYAQIVADVDKAIEIGLPVATTFPQNGRATMGAAKMLQAYVNMTMPTKDYTKAEAALLDITHMNYSFETNYADVFKPTNKNNKESIFECQYLEGSGGQNSNFCWSMVPKAINSKFLMGVSATSYSGGWNVPTQEMIDSYESGDLRLPASVAVAEGSLVNEDFTVTAVKSPVGYTPSPGVTGWRYFVTKYWHPPYSLANNTGDNFPFYRYSGALLLLAECLVNENKAADALPYLNQVRARAGLAPLTTATADNVANEMRHELAFENQRWTDLIRTGKAIEKLTAKGVTMKSLYGWLVPASFNVTQDRLIYPINFRELQVNKYLVQNPGY
jgi:hypothetical protein